MTRTTGSALLTASLFVLGVSAMLLSCYPESQLSIEDYDIVSTFYSKSGAFGTFRTYAMPDSVGKLGSGAGRGDYDALILSTIQDNMRSIGFTRVLTPDSINRPDVLVVAATTNSQYYATGCYPWYGWGYWGYYGGYYGCYPYTSYAYSSGTIMIAMTSLVPGRDTVQVEWLAGINGVLDGRSISQAIPTLITRAFDQSPYLRPQSR